MLQSRLHWLPPRTKAERRSPYCCRACEAPPPPCKLVIAVWSDQKELDKPSRNSILILQMKMETCLLKSRQLCQQAGLRQQET